MEMPIYEFLSGNSVVLAGTTLASDIGRPWGSIGAGGTFSWVNDKYALYGEVSYNTSLTEPGEPTAKRARRDSVCGGDQALNVQSLASWLSRLLVWWPVPPGQSAQKPCADSSRLRQFKSFGGKYCIAMHTRTSVRAGLLSLFLTK